MLFERPGEAFVAFDEELADRVRGQLADVPDLGERLMFGGIAFMVGGHMVCGVLGDELMLRLGEDGATEALAQPGTRPMDLTGRPMRTMVFAGPDAVRSDADLRRWIARARAHVAGLPPPRPARRRPRPSRP